MRDGNCGTANRRRHPAQRDTSRHHLPLSPRHSQNLGSPFRSFPFPLFASSFPKRRSNSGDLDTARFPRGVSRDPALFCFFPPAESGNALSEVPRLVPRSGRRFEFGQSPREESWRETAPPKHALVGPAVRKKTASAVEHARAPASLGSAHASSAGRHLVPSTLRFDTTRVARTRSGTVSPADSLRTWARRTEQSFRCLNYFRWR